MTQQRQRWDEIEQIWQQNQWLYTIVGFLLGLTTISALDTLAAGVSTLIDNLAPEIFGIAFTVLIIDQLYQRRERARNRLEARIRLRREIGSQAHATAVAAVRELRVRGWLYDGTLRGIAMWRADLHDSSLSKADLKDVNLQEADLSNTALIGVQLAGAALQNAKLMRARAIRANLREANLKGADCSGAKMMGTDLARARLTGANLTYANLQQADLTKANLRGADLRGTVLTDACLIGANMREAVLDEHTVLPDGTRWQADSDPRELARFITPAHPDFWPPAAAD